MSWKLKNKNQKRLDKEIGTIRKDWGGKLSVCLVYPNTYRVGMGNLAIHSIYKILNSRDDIVCERAFLPDPDELDEYVKSGADLISLESQNPMTSFDVVAFSISFENDYRNILPILSLAKIPHRVDSRNEHHPTLIAGGAAPTLNPKPISKIFDRIILGEFEAYQHEIPDLFSRSAACNLRHAKRFIKNLDEVDTQTTIYNEDVEFGKMHLIEVQRGCPRGCKYCATPTLYRPFRSRNAESIIEMVDNGLKYRKRFGLIGADLLSHPDFQNIATGIHSRGAVFSASSIRIDGIDETRAKLLASSKHRSIALGVEAGTENLRGRIGKKTSDERVLIATALLAKNGITKIRLYFMIGLPDEEDKDVLAIANLSKKVFSTIKQNAPKGSGSHGVDITISPFIPKMGTPFEKRVFAGEKSLKQKIKILKEALKISRGIDLSHDSIIEAASEAYLACADEEAIEFLEDLNGGFTLRETLAKHFNPK